MLGYSVSAGAGIESSSPSNDALNDESCARAPSKVELPSDFGARADLSPTGGDREYRAPTLLAGLHTPAQQAACLGAFAALLYRFVEQDEIAVDVRLLDPQTDTKTQATLRLRPRDDVPVSELIAGARELLEGLSRASGGARDGGANGSNVALTFVARRVRDADERARVDGAWLPREAELRALSRGYDLHLVLPEGEHASLFVCYDGARFLPATIEQLTESLRVLWSATLSDPNAALRQLALLSSAQIAALTTARDTGSAQYDDAPVLRLFQQFARSQPDAVAVRCQDAFLTYGELDRQSSRLAHHLIALGVAPQQAVAVCLQPSPAVLVALLAVFKAGAVYAPLDPGHPEALIGMMLEEAAPRAVLTQSSLRELTRVEGSAQFCFDLDRAALDGLPSSAPELALSLDQPSHLLYTSGTTGKPKGVLASQRNLAHYVQVARQRYGFCAGDVFCSLARYTFSISLFELLSPLCCGGTLQLLQREEILAPERLTRRLEQVTVLHAGPSLLGSLIRYLRTNSSAPRGFPNMRHASSGGDVVPPHLLEQMKEVFPNAELFVIYGCTEISCMGCTYPVSRSQTVTRSYVGAPFPDVEVRVLDAHDQLVPFGVKGEICFAGKGVVPGYFKRPELGAEKFVAIDGRRFYKTGDVGRLHMDGNLEMLGRRDYQVQLRGMRVELLGIESTVCALGLASQCAVAVKKLDDHDVRLVAFVVGARDHDVASFRRALAAQLPDYMIPHSVVPLEKLPLTANGKLDRKQLAALPWEPRVEAGSRAAPQNALEQRIAALFAEVLGAGAVGVDDDFFDLGGHSLSAIMLMEQLENTLGLKLSPAILFEYRTVRGIAEHAQDALPSEPKPILLSRDESQPALFMLAGVHLYRDFARKLEGKYSVYGVYAAKEILLFEAADSPPSVADLARDYVEIIRRQQPRGPYHLGGMSFGGIVAYEVAQQLRAQGEQVSFLGLLDSVLPEAGLKSRLAKARRLLRLPRRELWAWVHQRAQARLAGAQKPSVPSDFIRHAGDEKLRPLEDKRQLGYARAAHGYLSQIRSFDGNVCLVVAGARLKKDVFSSPHCGWRSHVRGLQVKTLEAEHLGLVEEPRVGEVADFFLRSLSA